MSVSTPIQQKLTYISGLISKLLRKNFGRGPDSCSAFANHQYLVFYIQGFLSPMETILLEHVNDDHVDYSRNIVMKSVLANLQGILEHEFEQDVKDFYHDWKYDKNTGVIIVVFESEVAPMDRNTEQFPECIPLIHEIQRISAFVQKTPEKTDVYRISSKLFLVKRTGILIPVAQALIVNGHRQILLDAINDLENRSYTLDGHFETIFKQPIADIFVDWNLNEDNSMICFVLR